MSTLANHRLSRIDAERQRNLFENHPEFDEHLWRLCELSSGSLSQPQPPAMPISTLVVHTTGGSTKEGALETWRREQKSSANYLITRACEVIEVVDPEDAAALHARGNNCSTIGIEFVASSSGNARDGAVAKEPLAISDGMLICGAQLFASLAARFNIKVSRGTIVPHRAINPRYTSCPASGEYQGIRSYADIPLADFSPFMPQRISDSNSEHGGYYAYEGFTELELQSFICKVSRAVSVAQNRPELADPNCPATLSD